MLNTFVSIAVAAETASSPAQQNTDPGMATLFFKLLLSLAIIIVLIYLVCKFIKNQQLLRSKTKERKKDWIRIVDYQGLGTNKGIYLIEIIDKIFAVAVSENSISTICEIGSSEEGHPEFAKNNEGVQTAVGIDLIGLIKGQLDEQKNRTHRILAKLTKGGTDVE